MKRFVCVLVALLAFVCGMVAAVLVKTVHLEKRNMSAIVLLEILHCLSGCVTWRSGVVLPCPQPGSNETLCAGRSGGLPVPWDVYWLAHLIIRGEPPAIFFFSACDVAYIGFLLMFNTALPGVDPQRLRQRPFAVWMAVFTLMNVVAWMVWTGAWFNNLLWVRSHCCFCRAQRHAGGKRPAPRQRRTAFFRTGGSIGFLRVSCARRRPYRVGLLPCASCYGVLSLVQLAFSRSATSLETAFCSGVGAYGGFL